MINMSKTLLAASAAASLCCSAALAQDPVLRSPDGTIALSGGIGLGYISASEFVYDGSHKNSELDFRSQAVTIYSAKLAAELPKGFNLRFGADIGTGGDGKLTDYDWNPAFSTTTSKNGWSDRSISNDTSLGHYWNATVELAHDIYATTDGLHIEGLAGFKYTDVKWNAFGGSYIYSTSALRDTIGGLGDGEKAISYRQKIPVAYIGLNGSQAFGKFTLDGGLNGGVSFGINDKDNHWQADTVYHEDMEAAPVVMADLGAAYEMTPHASLFLSGSFERVFRARGDLRSQDTTTGARTSEQDVAGALFQSVLFKFGVKGTF